MERRSCWRCQISERGLLQAAQESEALCESCLVWATQEALLHHGPISNERVPLSRRNGRLAPSLSAYPSSWQLAYRLSHLAYQGEIEVELPGSDAGKSVADEFYRVLQN